MTAIEIIVYAIAFVIGIALLIKNRKGYARGLLIIFCPILAFKWIDTWNYDKDSKWVLKFGAVICTIMWIGIILNLLGVVK